jgi:hypothetical protein
MVWTGVNKIFGENVFIVPVFPGQMIFQIVSPTCYIVPGDVKFHAEHPNILFQRFQMYFFVENVMSEFGQAALVGANRTANTSRGVGIFDLDNEVMTQLKKTILLTSKISIVEESSGRLQYAQSNIPLVYKSYMMSVLLNDF